MELIKSKKIRKRNGIQILTIFSTFKVKAVLRNTLRRGKGSADFKAI